MGQLLQRWRRAPPANSAAHTPEPPQKPATPARPALAPLTEEEAAALTQSAFLRRFLTRDLHRLDRRALNARGYELRYACNGGTARGFTRAANPSPGARAGAGAAFMPLAAVQGGIVGNDADRQHAAAFVVDAAASTFADASRVQQRGTCYAPRDFTLLHYACVDDEPKLVTLLLQRGADARASCGVRGKRCARGGITPLVVAAVNGCAGVETAIIAHIKRAKRRARFADLLVLVEQCAQVLQGKPARRRVLAVTRFEMVRLGAAGMRTSGPPSAFGVILWLATLDKYLRRGVMQELCALLVG